jgi:hypothetical protein
VVIGGDSLVDGNVSFCDICALSFISSAWGKTLAFARCWPCSILFVCMVAFGVIGSFYWEEIDRLLVYVQWSDWNCSEWLYQWMWVSCKLLFQGPDSFLKGADPKSLWRHLSEVWV